MDGEIHRGRASFDVDVDNLVLGSCGNASSFHVDSAGQNGRRAPCAGNDLSSVGIDCVDAEQVLEILGQVGSLGISGISGVRSSESSGLGSGRIHTDDGDGISGGGSETGHIHSGEVDGGRDGSAACGCDGDDPAHAR